jgi:ABC-2 type transport system permease protein
MPATTALAATTPGRPRTVGAAVLGFECRQLLRDRAFVGLACVLLLLTIVALASGVRWYHFQQQAVATTLAHDLALQREAEERGREILAGERPPPRGWWSNPADVRGYAYYLLQVHAIKPADPLTALTVGLSDVLPYYQRVGPGRQDKFQTAFEAEHPRRLLIGRFDATFVVLFVMPLLLIAAGFNALAAERETGRLPSLALHGVSPRRLVLLRVLLRAAVLALLLALTIGLGLLLSGVPIPAVAFAAWIALALAYLGLWTALVLAVVSVCSKGATVSLWLAGIWLLLLVIVPGLVNLLANQIHPLPSRAEFILAQRQASDEAEQRRAELLGRYLHDHPELSGVDTEDPVIFRFAANIAADEYVEREIKPVQQRFDERLQAQQRLIDRWQWTSPAIAMQLAMTELAGAGHHRQRAFRAQVDDYIAELRAFFYPRIARGEYRFDAYHDWPRWDLQPLSDQSPIDRWLKCLGMLIGLTVVGIAFAMRRLRRVRIV